MTDSHIIHTDSGTTPHPHSDRFVCPSCGVLAQFSQLSIFGGGNVGMPQNWRCRRCTACREIVLWTTAGDEPKMVFPLGMVGEAPSSDMPETVKTAYQEARHVAALSRRSAAALLRLALQMLVDELVPGSGDINAKIGRLVQQGLHPQVQQAMDVLRVVGNNAVHPGRIDLEEDPALVPALFRLINIVVEQMISTPKHTQSLFENLPQQSRDQIDRRDGNAVPATQP